jgi:S1-C subfamily serine protease
MEAPMNRNARPAALALLAACCSLAAALAFAAAPGKAPGASPPKHDEESAYRRLSEAAGAVVQVRTRALGNARSTESLGTERTGSGVLIAPSGLVLTIGYLILEADQVSLTDANGRTVPASVVAYDHATGFGLLRPVAPLASKPVALGNSAPVEELDRLMIASGGTEGGVTVATVVSRRPFAGYWEYLIDGAIFTSPPRLDHSGAALINTQGELVGIGSLLVMDAATPGERLPGNMFVPIDLLKPVLAEMIATGRQKAGYRPWIGVNALEEDGRIKVVRVTGEGPAEKAGLVPGDIILSLGGRTVETLGDFYKRLWSSGAPGVEVPLTVLHGAEVREVKVRSMDRLEFIRKKPSI